MFANSEQPEHNIPCFLWVLVRRHSGLMMPFERAIELLCLFEVVVLKNSADVFAISHVLFLKRFFVEIRILQEIESLLWLGRTRLAVGSSGFAEKRLLFFCFRFLFDHLRSFDALGENLI